MQAAFLLGQLEARGEIQARRRKVFDRYQAALSEWSRRRAVRMLEAAAEHPCHMFYLRLSGLDHRTEFIAGLRRAGVLAVSHYVPLHTSRMGRTYGYGKGDLPVTEAVADELVRLPMFATLGEEDQDAVIEATVRWRPAVRPEVARG